MILRISHEHGYISNQQRRIKYEVGREVELDFIYVIMNEDYEVQSGGARLGDRGEIVITTDDVNEGDAVHAKMMSKSLE